MLINCSNHPVSSWSEKQKAAAQIYGNLLDLPFPSVEHTADVAKVFALAGSYCSKVAALIGEKIIPIELLTHNLINQYLKLFKIP